MLYSATSYPCLFFQIYMTLREIEVEQSYANMHGDVFPSAMASSVPVKTEAIPVDERTPQIDYSKQ